MGFGCSRDLLSQAKQAQRPWVALFCFTLCLCDGKAIDCAQRHRHALLKLVQMMQKLHHCQLNTFRYSSQGLPQQPGLRTSTASNCKPAGA